MRDELEILVSEGYDCQCDNKLQTWVPTLYFFIGA